MEDQKDIKQEAQNNTEKTEKNINVETYTALELLQFQANDYKDKYLRALADYHNLQKRTDKEFTNGWYRGQNKIIEELLPFFDDFDRMIEHELDIKGATIVKNSLVNILTCNNISVIDPKEGEVFNEQFHDAIMVENTDNKNLDNHIKMTLTKGYKHNDEVIRYAAVGVYKYSEM